MPRSLRIAALLLTIVCIYSDAAAQLQNGTPDGVRQERDPQEAPPADSVRISLLTVLPGDDVYSLWGHSAIRVTDPESGQDVSYNYGTFDFEADWFVLRFMYGNLLYRLSRHDFDLALDHYRHVERRPVIEQVLHLSSAQQDSLVRFLRVNYRPENRLYAYDFLYDNCSTRIRDALERSLGEALEFADRPDPGATFRDLLDPYQREWPFLDAGIDWLLGAPVDRVAQPYETMFLPDYLMEAFEHATIEIDGERSPLVSSTDTLFWIEGFDHGAGGFPWEVAAGWLVFVLGIVQTLRAAKQDRAVLRILDPALFLIVGLAGLLITFLWFISLHEVTANNWHLLWSWPTHVIAGIALMRPRVPAWLAHYALAASVVALVAMLGIPAWPQAFHPVLMPIMLLVAVRGGWLYYRTRVVRRAHDAPIHSTTGP